MDKFLVGLFCLYGIVIVLGAPNDNFRYYNGNNNMYNLNEVTNCFDAICPSGTTGCRKNEKSEDFDYSVVKVSIECVGKHGVVLDIINSTKTSQYGSTVKINNYVYRGGISGENNSRPIS